MMKVLIVEDETAAYENLADMLSEVDSSIEIAGYTESINQTVSWFKKNAAPDLVFMDIHLSDGDAFSIFEKIQVDTPVIFTTAYDEYAIKAFKVNSIDYLLKPIKAEELNCAIEKFRRYSRPEFPSNLASMVQLFQRQNSVDRILVPDKDKLLPVSMEDISYFYTTEKNTHIKLRNGRALPYPKTLEQVELTLDPAEFIRANKQFIVSRKSVTNITIWFDSRLLVTLDTDTPERLYVSKNKAAEFKNWLIGKGNKSVGGTPE